MGKICEREMELWMVRVRSGREVRGVSPEVGRESMVGKNCERGRS